MEMKRCDSEFETLSRRLNDEQVLETYKRTHEDYKTSLLPRLFGNLLIITGNIVYGSRPSYAKFRAIEVIARVPYQSWASAAYTLLTLFYANEARAIRYAHVTQFARLAQDNETMHVVVISGLTECKRQRGIVRYIALPMLFAFFYFWVSYILYLINPRYSYELNYLFEGHAFIQYDRFLREHSEELREKKVESNFLKWYGREVANEFELFRSIRNDELIHRNASIEKIIELKQ